MTRSVLADGRPHMVLELCPGGSLAGLLLTAGALADALAAVDLDVSVPVPT